jgi:apolipoprotein N-acyltransferase
MNTSKRVLGGLALAALSGPLFLLAFPPYNAWPLAFVAFVPTILAQHLVVPARLSGLAFGVGFGAYWWAVYGPMFAGAVWFMEWSWPVVGGVAALMSMGNRAFHERTGYRWFVLEGPVGWVGIEAIRGLLPVVGTGGFVAYTMWSVPWAIQPVSVFSIYGLSLVIMLVNYALGLGAMAVAKRMTKRSAHTAAPNFRLALGWFVGVVLVGVAWVGLSLALLEQGSVEGTSVRVAAIQPAGSSSLLAAKEKLWAQTREAAAQGAQLIVWPEGALPYDPQVRQAEELRALARETHAYLAVGYAPPGPPVRNEITLVSPEGEFLGVYGKDHPVVWMGEGSTTRGTYPAYSTPLGAIGTIICYDLNFTDTSRKVAANGAQLLAAGSHDWASLGTTQYTNLVMRAVENRTALVKADANYDSAIIDPLGRVVARFVAGTPTAHILIAGVPLGAANAPLIRLGDWMAWVCLAGFAMFTVAGPLTGRRATRAGQPASHHSRLRENEGTAAIVQSPGEPM